MQSSGDGLRPYENERRPFHSKYFGTPGSITALRLNYDRSSHAYENVEPNTLIRSPRARTRIRQEVLAWKHASQLGAQPEWSPSVQLEGERATVRFPSRALMHTLSAYQTTPLPISFRDTALPDLYKRTLYLPRSNKFSFDTSCFHGDSGAVVDARCMSSPSGPFVLKGLLLQKASLGSVSSTATATPERTVLKGSNQIATLAQKGVHMGDMAHACVTADQWNASTTLPTERSGSCKAPLRKETSLRPLTRFAELRLPLFTEGRYRDPRKRVEMMNAEYTEKKRLERSGAHSGGALHTGMVYKLSNMRDWARSAVVE